MRQHPCSVQNVRSFSKSLILLFFILGQLISATAQTDKEKLQNRKKNLEKEIDNTNKLLEQTRKTTRVNVQQLQLIQGQITNQQKLVGLIYQEISSLNAEMKLLDEQIVKLEKELELLKSEYAKMIYFSYLTRNSYHRLMFIFASESMNEAFQRYRYLQEYAANRRRQAELIQVKQAELNEHLQTLEKVKEEKFQLLRQQETEVNNLNKQKKEKDKTIKDLQTQEQKLRADIKKKQQEAQKLQRQIEELIRKEIEAANKKANTKVVAGSSMPMTTEELEISRGFAGNRGRLPWPVDNGVITGKFGEHPHPVISGIKIKNNGIDITTRQNTQVRAVFDGSVSAIFTLPNEAKAVIVRHGDYLTVYANLKTVQVKKDDKVKASAILGTVSTDASVNSAVFHFEVWKEKTIENPEFWLRNR
jgi:murein hydrolase activator